MNEPIVQPPTTPMPPAPAVSASGGMAQLAIIAGVLLALAGGSYWWWTTYTPVPEASAQKHIGILSFRQFNDVVAGFKAEMTRLGYTNVQYEEVLDIPGPAMLQDIDTEVRQMVADNVDAIWTSLEMQAKAAVDITAELGRTDIPVVFMTRFHDPITYGLIASFPSSGNNSTGVVTDLSEIVERNLAFLKDINPNFKTLGIFTSGFMVADIGGEVYEEVIRQAPLFGFNIVEYTTEAPPPQAEAAFNEIAAAIKKGDIDGLFHIGGHFHNTQEEGEGKLAIRLGIPMVAPYEDLPNGGLFSYSDDFGASGRQTARILDRIFKGARPTDIPVAYTAENVLTLMTDRATQAGVVFPESMLFIAKNKYTDDSPFVTESLVHGQTQ